MVNWKTAVLLLLIIGLLLSIVFSVLSMWKHDTATAFYFLAIGYILYKVFDKIHKDE